MTSNVASQRKPNRNARVHSPQALSESAYFATTLNNSQHYFIMFPMWNKIGVATVRWIVRACLVQKAAKQQEPLRPMPGWQSMVLWVWLQQNSWERAHRSRRRLPSSKVSQTKAETRSRKKRNGNVPSRASLQNMAVGFRKESWSAKMVSDVAAVRKWSWRIARRLAIRTRTNLLTFQILHISQLYCNTHVSIISCLQFC